VLEVLAVLAVQVECHQWEAWEVECHQWEAWEVECHQLEAQEAAWLVWTRP
jgi:hypothetical protein